MCIAKKKKKQTTTLHACNPLTVSKYNYSHFFYLCVPYKKKKKTLKYIYYGLVSFG